MAREVAGTPAAAAEQSGTGIFYGYYLIGAALVAQFVSIGSQNYIIGAFFKPMTSDLGWTRSEFTLGRTVAQFVMAFTGFSQRSRLAMLISAPSSERTFVER